jgi:hypothetical protein
MRPTELGIPSFLLEGCLNRISLGKNAVVTAGILYEGPSSNSAS